MSFSKNEVTCCPKDANGLVVEGGVKSLFSGFGSFWLLVSACRQEDEEEGSRLGKTGAGRKATTPQNKQGKRRSNPLRRRLLDGAAILVSTRPVGVCGEGKGSGFGGLSIVSVRWLNREPAGFGQGGEANTQYVNAIRCLSSGRGGKGRGKKDGEKGSWGALKPAVSSTRICIYPQ